MLPNAMPGTRHLAGIAAPLRLGNYAFLTFAACGPFLPSVISNST